MNEEKLIEIKKSVFERNEKLAAEFNARLTSNGIYCVNVLGAPGVGKTSTLIQIMQRLGTTACVIEGDIESDIDTQKLNALGYPTVQINTGGACHLDAPIVADVYAKLPVKSGFLFIENIGNLVCPVSYLLGEHIKLLICTTTDGSDKPYKYPHAFEKSDVILLNKCDLLKHVDFDLEYFTAGIKKLNPSAPIFMVSAATGEGFAEVVEWLLNKAKCIV